MEKATLVQQNEFTKVFTYGESVSMYAHKAVDNSTGKDRHFILFSIPILPDMGVEQINYPMEFDTIENRDELFTNLDGDMIMERIREQIVENRKLMEEKNEEANNEN